MAAWRGSGVAASRAVRVLAALAVLAASLVLDAGPAAASRLETHVRKVFDGVAPFADWEPGNTNLPLGGFVNRDPGDDFDDQDGFVRTLDTTLFEVEYTVDDPGLPNAVVVLNVTVNGGARIKEDWVVNGCPAASINPARTQLQCTIAAGSFTSSTSTLVALEVVAPMSVKNGTPISVTSTLSEAGNPVADTETSPSVIVSAAPRYDLLKEGVGIVAAGGPLSGGTQPGFTQEWFIGIRGLADDPRGLSQLDPPTITLADALAATPGVDVHVQSCGRPPGTTGWPSVVTAGGLLPQPDSQLRAATVTCPPIGVPVSSASIHLSGIDWNRAAPPPETSSSGAIPPSRSGLIALFRLVTWTSTDQMDAAIPPPGDSRGTVLVSNSVETGAGTCAGTNVLSPAWAPSSTSTWHPVDISGLPNLLGSAEPVENNGDCLHTEFAPNASAQFRKRPVLPGNGGGVLPDTTTRSRLELTNTGNIDFSAGAVICDKWDNSRFGPSDPATYLNPFGGATYDVEYGQGPWGAAPAASSLSDSEKWFRQAHADCSNSTATWVPESDVLGGTVDIDDMNMVRITVLTPVKPAVTVGFEPTWTMRPNLPLGEQYRNYSAFRPGPASSWQVSTCTRENVAQQTCDPVLDAAEGAEPTQARSHWWSTIAGTVQVTKFAVGPTTVEPGDPVTWRVLARAVPWNTNTAQPNLAGTTHGIQIVEVLPTGFSYVGPTVGFNEPTSCTTDPVTQRMTCVWDVGDLPWNTAPFSFDVDFTFSTVADAFAKAGTYRNDVRGATPDDPRPYGQLVDIRVAAVEVNVITGSRVAIDKSVSPAVPKPGETVTFTMRFGNPTGKSIAAMDAVDLLPFGGDARGSLFAGGSFTLTGLAHSTKAEAAWVSAVPGPVLDLLDNQADGFLDPAFSTPPTPSSPPSAQWPCTFEQVGTTACPPFLQRLDQVTAIRFTGSGAPFLGPSEGPFAIALTFRVEPSAAPGDRFVNSWVARFEGFASALHATAKAATIAASGPALTVTKEVGDGNGNFGPAAALSLGDPVDWRITVTNTGGTTLRTFAVDDPALAACEAAGAAAAPAALAPGESFTFVCTDPGATAGYENTVTVTAMGPDGGPVGGSGRARVDIIGPPAGVVAPIAKPRPLARTGAPVGQLVGDALLALAAGLAMVTVAGRRRRLRRPLL